MPFIGKAPETGAFRLIDSITTSATDTYALTVQGDYYFPASARNLIVSLNGVTQAPESAYTVSGSHIVFASALTANDVIDYILVIGDAVDIGTPSDGTVGNAQLKSSLDFSGKTLTFSNDQISGDAIDGGTASVDTLNVGGGYGDSGATIYSTGNISTNGGNLIGNVIGDLTGDVTGDVTGQITLDTNGSESFPAISFSNASNTGIYRVSDNSVGFTSNGSFIGKFHSNGLIMPEGKRVQFDTSSATAWDIKQRSVPGSNTTYYYLDFKFNGSRKAYLDTGGSSVLLNFTGQHKTKGDEETYLSSSVGLIVSSTGDYISSEQQKININEALPFVKLSDKKEDKAAFGVISDAEDPNESTREYKMGNFVSVSEKTEDDNRIVINSLGEGGIWVTNINGDLENGDFITTSDIPGYGMKQNDDLLHNYTVAKITCDCSFDLDSEIYNCEEFEFEGQIYRKAFVGCTYHCG